MAHATDKKHPLISDDLRSRIRAGEFAGLIPGQRALADHYQVNFLTVRKAVATLVKEGLLDRQPGRGTFVTHRKRERTRTFAAVLGGLSFGLGGQHAALIQGIEREASRHRHDVLLRPHEPDARAEDRVIEEILRSEKVDGVLLWPGRSGGKSSAAARLRDAGMPCVVMMRIDAKDRDRVSYVIDDDDCGGCLATKHLLDLGHRRIGYLSRSAEGTGELFEEERWRGFQQAHADLGISPGPRLLADGMGSRKFLSKLQGLTGLFCMNDRLALQVLNYQKAWGIEIPGDLSVVGYDDMEAADLLGLTTVHQPMREIGAEAVKLLLAQVESPVRAPESAILVPRLVVRQSTAKWRP